MKCAEHPNVETNLTCGRCGTPICPKCLIQTPVGARCSKCAGTTKLPTFTITPKYYLKALVVGLVMTIVLGTVWAFLLDIRFFSFFSLLLGIGMGYLMGNAISLSVNRKRGRWLQLIAGSCIAFSYMVALYSGGTISFDLWDLLVLGAAIFIAVSRL